MGSLEQIINEFGKRVSDMQKLSDICEMLVALNEVFDPEIRFVASATKTYSDRFLTMALTTRPTDPRLLQYATELGQYSEQLYNLLQDRHPDIFERTDV